MTLPPIKLWHVLALILAAMVAGMYYWYKSSHPSFRYRLTVELEVSGKTLKSSSIIDARYLLGNTDGNGLRFYSSARGVAPIFDLGPDGTLIAALGYDAEYFKVGQIPKDGFFPYRMPTDATHIPLRAYGVPPEEIKSVKGQAQLDPEFYPAFVWIPAQSGWRNAQQMFHDEIAAKIGPHIRVTKITVEPARWESIKTTVDPAPAWLIGMRHDHRYSYIVGYPNRFNFSTFAVERAISVP